MSARGERIIASGRLLLAVFSLFMLPAPAAALLAAYALLLALVAWRAPAAAARYRMLLHASDFFVYAVLAQLPYPPLTLFYVVCLVFVLASALIRFGQAADPVGEERIRVARDLHDGLLQSLTGAALQLEALHKLVGVDDDAVRQRLRRVQELIEDNQRELRTLIGELRPQLRGKGPLPLGVRLLDLAERFERQWDVAVSVSIDPPLPALSDELAAEIYSIVSEGVANAAKHARATRIDATVSSRGGRVEITVVDDGKGFPFEGEFDLRALDELRRGPVTLKERVASLGGELLLQSSPRGARLQIRI